ncbi:MAG TPA: Gfo/Idh/MocA family oxidoreductase [Verrucomicrobiales bacterium]|nr:Gfo/Idh/MocA family oxidoreductase [Verrucomicrobiales bacterium]
MEIAFSWFRRLVLFPARETMSEEKIRIGVIGMHHDHLWSNLEELLALPGVDLVGGADPYEALRERFAGRTSRPVYEDPLVLLDKGAPEAVLVFGDNRWSAEWATEAAKRGMHVLIEKPLAADLEGAEELYGAARENGARLMVNWPFAWWAPLHEAIRLAAQGKLGRIWQVRYRAAHGGPREEGCSEWFCDWLFDAERNGGGALMDYCGYGAILARVLLGMPESVQATAGTLVKAELEVDDNALLVMSYTGAMGLAEASWTEVGRATSYRAVIYGTAGVLIADPFGPEPLRLAEAEHPLGQPLAVPDLPASLRSASAHFLHGVASGDAFAPLCEAEANRDVQAILAAGMESARSGQAIVP